MGKSRFGNKVEGAREKTLQGSGEKSPGPMARDLLELQAAALCIWLTLSNKVWFLDPATLTYNKELCSGFRYLREYCDYQRKC
jgi:hypothetical protein